MVQDMDFLYHWFICCALTTHHIRHISLLDFDEKVDGRARLLDDVVNFLWVYCIVMFYIVILILAKVIDGLYN